MPSSEVHFKASAAQMQL